MTRSTGVSSPVMFVVTGLTTKRRPRFSTDKRSATTWKRCVEELTQLPAVSHPPNRRLHPAKLSGKRSSSVQAVPRVSEPRFARNDSDMDPRTRRAEGRQLPTKAALVRVAPPRVRKFIPKPLILVERMKARQSLLDSMSSVVSESRGPLILVENRVTTSSTHLTPTMRRIPTCGSLLSDSHLSSSVSVRVSSRNGVVFGSGFGMMPRPTRPLSAVTLGDSSSSTDTFVADSPCFVKQTFSKAPLLVAASEATHTKAPVLVDSVSVDFMHQSLQSIGAFDPAATSTPFGSSCTDTNSVPSTSFTTSTVYPPHLQGQTHNLASNLIVASPTSRDRHPFNTPKDAYTIKLPESRSTALKLALGSRRQSNRGAPSSPTLVLDGVFALPPPPVVSPRRMLNTHAVARPRKPSSRQPLSDISNGPTAVAPSDSLLASLTPPSLRGPGLSCPDSPRSKLAHVLTAAAHARPPTHTHMTTRVRKPARVPPLVRGVEVSNDPRTQCEIEGLRVRCVVRLSHSGDGCGGAEGGGRGAIERMSLASVGMVARLRARWEAGTVACCDSADGRA